MSSFLAYFSAAFLSTSPAHRTSMRLVNGYMNARIYYQDSEDAKSLVRKSEVIIGLPTEIPISDLAVFKKQVSQCKQEVMGAASMTRAIDSTPFCLMTNLIKGRSHLFVFVHATDVSRVNESLMKWIRGVSKGRNGKYHNLRVIVAKRSGHCMAILI